MNPPLNILVLEDNPLDTELMLKELRRSGFDPEWVRVDNESDYLKHLHAELDLILSDFDMPQFNGTRALELLKESGFDIPFILISGTIGEETAVQAMKQGATDYLLKDRLTRLGSAIQHALDENHLRKERKVATEALRLREVALNAVSQGAIITDENRRIIYSNTSFTQLTGYSASEIMGQNCSFLQGPETDPATILAIRAALNGAQPFEGEILNYRKDGTPFWNDLSIAPIPGAEGQPLRFIGIQRDTTTRKQAETDLQQSEARFAGAFEQAPIGMALVAIDGRWLKVNRSLCEVVGYSEAELLCSTFQEITAPEDLGIDLENVRRLLAGEITHYQIEKRYIHADQHLVPVLLSVSLVRDDQREPLYFIAQIQDITERKREEESVRLSAERLQLAARAGRVGIWEFDCLSGLLTWDDQMFVLYGKSRNGSDDVSKRWVSSIHPEDRSRTEAELMDALDDDAKPFNTRFRIIRKNDGATRFIRARASLLRDESGRAWRMIGTNWDITDAWNREQALSFALAQEKDLSEKARAGDKAKGEFLAVMSHELRTPLNGILGFSELLASSPDLSAESRDYVETIISSGDALLRLLNDVLDFSRFEAGNVQIEKTKFDPEEIIGDVHTLLVQQARDKQLALQVEICKSAPTLMVGDPGRLQQILLNLVGNAIKFTEHGGVTVGIRTARTAGMLEFFVKDTGSGITACQAERIFQPFTQADSSISRRHGGTGLGLSISRSLAELMGGTLTVLSKSGQGSEFIATLPCGDIGPPPVIPPAVQQFDQRFACEHPLHILVVEDDKVNLKLMINLLRRLGYQAFAANMGAEALEIYRRELPNCVLMDLQMPGMDGIETTKQIRLYEKAIHTEAPAFISALTANVVPIDRQRCLDAGMNTYLNKPIKMAALAAMLAEAGVRVNQSLLRA